MLIQALSSLSDQRAACESPEQHEKGPKHHEQGDRAATWTCQEETALEVNLINVMLFIRKWKKVFVVSITDGKLFEIYFCLVQFVCLKTLK